jgi:uncharacterized protein (TIGR03083 family)
MRSPPAATRAEARVTVVRPATAADVLAIDAVLAAAFGGDQVPRLVHALRGDTLDADRVELVAEDAGQVVGHVLVTPIPLETAPGVTTTLACLSPLGVRPDVSGRGIGSTLVRAALTEAERRGERAVVLEGDPRYYRRFGFVPSSGHGLRRPSERTPEAAFQVRLLRGPAPRGRALYPRAFWDADAVGLPFDGVPWLDELERACRFVECAVTGDVLAAPVPSCPGWDVAELLRHVGVVQRTVTEWIGAGRHPRSTPSALADGDVRAWFAHGWRRLQEVLDGGPPGTPAPTWCPWDATLGFWRRRQAHEHLVHAIDVAQALGSAEPDVPDAVALDGVDEVLRLWLGTQLGQAVGGRGDMIRVLAGDRSWTVGLHAHLVEVHDSPVEPDAVVRAEPAVLYRWLWGRAPDSVVEVEGDRGVVAELRSLLARAMA